MRTLPQRLIAFTLAGLLGAAPVAGAAPVKITAADQRDVMITVYNGNLGLVKDVREVRLDAGLIETHFMDVAAQIDPTSVLLRSLTDPAGLKILEQNYEYDLLSSEKLMEKYVGRKVRLYQSNGTFQEATLLSTRGPGLRHQRPDPHGALRQRGAARAAREPGVEADAGLAAAQHAPGAPAGGGLLSHRRHQLEVRLRDADQRGRLARRPHRLGHHQQPERGDLPGTRR